MRTMVITFVMVFMVGITVAWAATDSRRQAAEDLLETVHMDEVLSQTIDQILALQVQQNPRLEPYVGVMKEFFNKYMSWEALKEDFIRIYMEEFTEDELRDMIAFYKTPTGQKAIMKMPILAAKGAELGQVHVQENIDELRQMIEAENQRLEESQEQMEQEQPQRDIQDGAEQQQEQEGAQ